MRKIAEGFMEIYFCYPVNQNILSIALKNGFRHLKKKMLYKSG